MENKAFLDWIINRLIYKHGYAETDHAIYQLQEIKKELEPKPPKPFVIELNDREFDLVLSKYFVDFNMDYSPEGNCGFTHKQREKLREDMKMFVIDVANKLVPSKPLIE